MASLYILRRLDFELWNAEITTDLDTHSLHFNITLFPVQHYNLGQGSSTVSTVSDIALVGAWSLDFRQETASFWFRIKLNHLKSPHMAF